LRIASKELWWSGVSGDGAFFITNGTNFLKPHMDTDEFGVGDQGLAMGELYIPGCASNKLWSDGVGVDGLLMCLVYQDAETASCTKYSTDFLKTGEFGADFKDLTGKKLSAVGYQL
jgi:hypothetical protein